MNLLDLYLDYCAPLKGSINYHRWCLISTVSALLERRVWLSRQRKGVLFPNTYILLVGPPSTGKGYSMSISMGFFDGVMVPTRRRPHLGPIKVTSAALYEEFKESAREYRINGVAYKQSPMYVCAEELSVNFDDFGGGTMTSELLNFFDSKAHNKLEKKRTISGGKIELINPSMTLLGGTTQEYLQQAAMHGIVNTGLSSRIIFVVENSLVEKQRDDVLDDPITARKIQNQLNEIYKMQGPMTLTPDAIDVFKSLARGCDLQGNDPTLSLFYQYYFGRKPDSIAKVAMCFAAMRSSMEISSDDLLKSAAWLEALEPSMASAFGLRSIEKDINLQEQISSCMRVGVPLRMGDILINLRNQGKYIPVNGTLTALMKSLTTTGQVTERIQANEVYYLLNYK